MNWKIIPKENSIQPETGTYKDWKETISEEGFFQCVYCSIHESNFGGIRNFHVEHYKPKSNVRFRELENDIINLFYACSICNCFKGPDWPSDPKDELNTFFYPDPSRFDYSKLFRVEANGVLIGLNITGMYILNKLYLNRPQLIMERRQFKSKKRLDDILTRLRTKETKLFELIKFETNQKIIVILKDLRTTINNILLMLNRESSIRPYTGSQVKK